MLLFFESNCDKITSYTYLELVYIIVDRQTIQIVQVCSIHTITTTTSTTINTDLLLPLLLYQYYCRLSRAVIIQNSEDGRLALPKRKRKALHLSRSQREAEESCCERVINNSRSQYYRPVPFPRGKAESYYHRETEPQIKLTKGEPPGAACRRRPSSKAECAGM